jgi:hypothetical protein
MTPKEKAKELVDKFTNYVSEKDFFGDNVELINCKQCALIAVDEILDDDMYGMEEEHFENRIDYWEKVRQEIENL